MIVLPNRLERYISALRIYTSFSISKHGFTDKHLKNLRKITLCEAYFYGKELNVTAIKLLSLNLLSCIAAEKPSFSFTLNLNKNVFINKQLYIILLILLSNESNYLKIEFKNGIEIYGKGKIKNCLSVIKNLKGSYFFDVKTNKFLIFLPCEETDKNAANTESQWHFIYDKFSLLNLFLNK